MGMTTVLHFDAQLTDEGVRVVEALTAAFDKYAPGFDESGAWEAVMPLITAIAEERGTDPAVPKTYLEQSRADFIPFGSYGGPHHNDLDGNTWTVLCELKNYDATIPHFLRAILPLLLAKPVEAYSQYEECDEPTEHLVVPA